jgi:hypothetical protein
VRNPRSTRVSASIAAGASAGAAICSGLVTGGAVVDDGGTVVLGVVGAAEVLDDVDARSPAPPEHPATANANATSAARTRPRVRSGRRISR